MTTKKSYSEQIQIANFLHTLLQIDISLIHNLNPILELSNNVYSTAQPFNSYDKIINLTEKNEEHCTLVTDSFSLSYLLANIPSDNPNLKCSFVIGPFLTENFSEESILTIMIQNKLPLSKKGYIENFYNLLHIFSKDYIFQIQTLLKNILTYPFLGSEFNQTELQNQPTNSVTSDNSSIQSIEERYFEQKKLNHIIETGNLSLAKKYIGKFDNYFLLFKDRVNGNFLRSAKNTAIVGNTNSRLAAEQAGVHPFYLDQISNKYAIRIEKCQSVNDITELCHEMLLEYCKLVNRYTTRKYSPIVAECVSYINVHFSENIHLDNLSKKLNINKTYLCKIFKKETHVSITEYINQCRVTEAKFLLQNKNISLSEIAYLLGFNDYSYFSRVFKKFTGTSPKQLYNAAPKLKE